MGQLPEHGRSMPPQSQPEVAEKKTLAKKRYAFPSLMEYGSLAKLTHGSGGTMNDGVGSTMPCL